VLFRSKRNCIECDIPLCSACIRGLTSICWLWHYTEYIAEASDPKEAVIAFAMKGDVVSFRSYWRYAIEHNFPEYIDLYDKLLILR
jgi:hypothetical protein